jgi:hypothetical protein
VFSVTKTYAKTISSFDMRTYPIHQPKAPASVSSTDWFESRKWFVILQKVTSGTRSTQSKIKNGKYLVSKHNRKYFQLFVLDQHINFEGFPASLLTQLLYILQWEHFGRRVKLTVHFHVRPTILGFLQSVQISGRLVPWNTSDNLFKTLTYSTFRINVWSSRELNKLFSYMASSDLTYKNVKIKNIQTIILPVVLYECETWYLILMEEHGVFVNRVLRRIFRPKRD